ncbi:MAG: hypothetical protein HOP16_02885 [Acidobacteria bacterium]|nr:hypothetical protein [Acidobacteriota bacterium]
MAWLMFVMGGDMVGAGPFVDRGPKNSAEAAGLARAADVLRFLRMGEDPHRVYPVRPEVISSAVLRVTTLEAAMWSRQLELVQLLDDQHSITREDRATLACLAADLKVDDVVEYLAPEGTGYCTPGQTLERVIARSRGL